jgi:uncharacterized Fe-S cluster-containing radical SAM superfamily protein
VPQAFGHAIQVRLGGSRHYEWNKARFENQSALNDVRGAKFLDAFYFEWIRLTSEITAGLVRAPSNVTHDQLPLFKDCKRSPYRISSDIVVRR